MTKSFPIAGHIAKDIHIKIDDVNSLPSLFSRLLKVSTPISELAAVLGHNWSLEDVLDVLRGRTMGTISWDYGGRRPNVAYGVGLLGGCVELIGFVGDDFDGHYSDFSDGVVRVVLTEVLIRATLGSSRASFVGPASMPKDKHGSIFVASREPCMTKIV